MSNEEMLGPYRDLYGTAIVTCDRCGNPIAPESARQLRTTGPGMTETGNQVLCIECERLTVSQDDPIDENDEHDLP